MLFYYADFDVQNTHTFVTHYTVICHIDKTVDSQTDSVNLWNYVNATTIN